MKTISKILSVVLCLTMVLGLFVVGASATSPNPSATEADFNTIVPKNANGDSGYGNTYTTANGWTTVNSAIQCGGTKDSNPQFQVIGSTTDSKAVCLNGKVSAPGKITSPTLTGGISKLTINYTKMFTDTKLAAQITITDLATGTVYTNTLQKEAEKNDKYTVWTFEWVLETPITGDFTIEVLNTCPTAQTGNKDRLTILDLSWTASSGSGSVTPPPATEPTTEPTTAPTEAPTTAPSTDLTVVTAPVAGTAYKFGMIQPNVSSTNVYYLTGAMNGYYMDTTLDASAAIDVYLETTTGGYYLYTTINGTKTYINMVVSGTHVNGAYEAAASTVYTYDETSDTLIAVVNDADYWFGTRNDKTYTTVGPCAVSYAGFYCQFYAEAANEPIEPPVTEPTTEPTTAPTEAPTTAPSSDLVLVTAPEAGVAYKFGMIQPNVSSTDVYYLTGAMNGYYMDTTTDVNASIDLFLEATEGGYYLYTNIDGVKTYINMVVSGTHVNGAYEAAPSTVYTFDAESNTLIASIDGKDYWFGTRNDKTYTTVGPCATSYAGFYCQFYGAKASEKPIEPAPTGDSSFISVAVAALVLSVLGGTALVMKKKEN